jgi:DNA-binding NtrC family response regulator
MPTPARVLLVEDDVATLDLFSDALRRAGFEVDGARSVGEALERLAHREYAVVLADHGLSDIPGLDFLAALSGAVPRTPRLLCSGLVTDELLAQAREFGVFAVLSKPISLEMLVVTVSAAVQRGGRLDV